MTILKRKIDHIPEKNRGNKSTSGASHPGIPYRPLELYLELYLELSRNCPATVPQLIKIIGYEFFK